MVCHDTASATGDGSGCPRFVFGGGGGLAGVKPAPLHQAGFTLDALLSLPLWSVAVRYPGLISALAFRATALLRLAGFIASRKQSSPRQGATMAGVDGCRAAKPPAEPTSGGTARPRVLRAAPWRAAFWSVRHYRGDARRIAAGFGLRTCSDCQWQEARTEPNPAVTAGSFDGDGRAGTRTTPERLHGGARATASGEHVLRVGILFDGF